MASRRISAIGLAILLVLAVVQPPQAAHAQFTSTPSFTSASFTAGTEPRSSAVGDFNGDGRIDLVIANLDTDNVSVLFNTMAPGATTPVFAAKMDFGAGNAPFSVAVGDLNGDGKLDLAVANLLSDNVSVLINVTVPGAAAPSFATSVAFDAGNAPHGVALGDINGDGKLDLVVSNHDSDNVSVLLNLTTSAVGLPSFAADVVFVAEDGPEAVALGDVNGDGKLDIVVVNLTSDSVSVIVNTTAPGATTATFSAHEDYSVGNGPLGVALTDLNGDGLLDVVTANGSSDDTSVLLNHSPISAGILSFFAHVEFPAGNGARGVTPGDVNGDGRPDLIVANITSDSVSVLVNTTGLATFTPTFATTLDLPAGNGPHVAALADFNRDGRLDVAVPDFFGDTVTVLLNSTPTPVGARAMATRTEHTADAGAREVAVGDFNGDGQPDLAIANQGDNTVSVRLNSTSPGAAGTVLGTGVGFATGDAPLSVAAGDLNGDGKPDLVVVTNDPGPGLAGNVNVLLNTTTPGASIPAFSSVVGFAVGDSSQGLALGDFNGDGRPDVAATNVSAATVSVLLNTTVAGASTPNFAAHQDFPTQSSPRSVAAADFNGDGKVDMAVANLASDSVSVLLNTTTPFAATPAFSTTVNFTAGDGASFVVARDINGDGRPDLAVVNLFSNNVSILLNTTGPGDTVPSFSPKQDFFALSEIGFLALGDLNLDGKPDLAIANQAGNSLGTAVNTTAPGAAGATFGTLIGIATVEDPLGIALADLNMDGKLDVVVASPAEGEVGVHLNTPYGAVQFSGATSSVSETGSNPPLSLQLVRDAAALQGPVSVTVQQTGGTAMGSGTDFLISPTTVNWANGNTTAQTVPLTVTHDGGPEGDETIILTLGNPTPGLGLGASTSTLTIIDDECLNRNIGVSVVPGGPGALTATITPRAPATITNILFKGGGDPGHITPTNVTYGISGGPQNQTGNVNFVPANGANPVIVTLTRTTGSGSATLPFDVTDQCGTQAKFAGGGPTAWPGGGSGSSGDAPTVSPSAPAQPAGSRVPGAACASFPTHAAAQAHLRNDPTDPLLLDRNRNGIACEGADGAGFVNPPLDHVPVPRP
jgi:hypothetical protein